MELCNYPCRNKVCVFNIEAIQIPIVYNRYGDPAPPILHAYVGNFSSEKEKVE